MIELRFLPKSGPDLLPSPFHLELPSPLTTIARRYENRHRPRIMILDSIVGSTGIRELYDYDDDQAHPQTSGVFATLLYWCCVSHNE